METRYVIWQQQFGTTLPLTHPATGLPVFFKSFDRAMALAAEDCVNTPVEDFTCQFSYTVVAVQRPYQQ